MGDIRTSSLGGIPFGGNSGRPANPQTGQPYFNGETQLLELYSSSSAWKSVVPQAPLIASVSGNILETNSVNTIVISGSNFAGNVIVSLISSSASETLATTVVVNSDTQITATFGVISVLNEPYTVKVLNSSSGMSGYLNNALYVNNTPTWNTSAGTLGSIYDSARVGATFSISATDPEGATMSYSIASGSLPTGMTLNSSTGVISGTANAAVSDTVYTFTGRASDGSNASDRAFSITVKGPTKTVFSHTGSSQTFSIPAGITKLKAKIWAAAGGEYNAGTNLTNSGGAGGYTETTFNVLNGETTLTIIVGGGPTGNSWNVYGGGGSAINGGTGGGGCSAILSGNISSPFVSTSTGLGTGYVPQQSLLSLSGAIGVIAVAGGGGGAGWYNQDNQVGGNGGGLSGRNGSGYTTTIAGTQSSSTNGNQSAGAGKFQGGYISANQSSGGSGGGGGGWYGGGAAQGSGQNAAGAGGSGFVGYVDGSTSSVLSPNQADSISYIDVIIRTNGTRTYNSSKCLASAAGTFTPPNNTDPDYVAGIGVATYYPGNDGTNKAAGNGLVVISY